MCVFFAMSIGFDYKRAINHFPILVRLMKLCATQSNKPNMEAATSSLE